MGKQTRLPLFGETALRSLWWRFSESQRREVVRQYARLIARAARGGDRRRERDDDRTK